jgi:zinc/manganese transport system ATP-binding protein
MSPIAPIELQRLSLGWRGQPVICEVSGRFEAGSMTAIVGPNGAGKSTLIKGIMGMLPPLAGHVWLAGGSPTAVAWLPQAADVDPSFPISVLEMVALGAWGRVGAWRRYSDEEIERTLAALKTVGLAHLAKHRFGTLSGGQTQRALFARMLVQDAPTLLLDEPFAGVDRHTAEELMALLCRLHQQGRTVVVVLHDLDLVRRHFPRTLLLSNGRAIWGDTEQVLADVEFKTAYRWQEKRAL